ncbi:MAG: PAS domain S-box protein [Candidatus Krumholzibacteriia bacterium]
MLPRFVPPADLLLLVNGAILLLAGVEVHVLARRHPHLLPWRWLTACCVAWAAVSWVGMTAICLSGSRLLPLVRLGVEAGYLICLAELAAQLCAGGRRRAQAAAPRLSRLLGAATGVLAVLPVADALRSLTGAVAAASACTLLGLVVLTLLTRAAREPCPGGLDGDAGFLHIGERWRVALMLAAVLAICGARAQAVARARDAGKREDLLVQVRMAAAGLDPADLRDLRGEPTDESRAAYYRLRARLIGMQLASPQLRWLYLMAQRDGQVVFTVNSVPEGMYGHIVARTPYAGAPAEFTAAFTTGDATTFGPYTDGWGSFITGLVGLRDPDTGRLWAALGVDINAARFAADIAASRLSPLDFGALLTLVLLGVHVWRLRERAAAARLIASEQRHRSLVEGAPSSILLCDGEARILAVNRAGVVALGRDENALRGTGLVSLWPLPERPAVAAAVAAVLRGGQPGFSATSRRPDGRDIVWEGVLTPIAGADQRQGRFMGILTDVTERHRAQAEQARLASAIAHAGEAVVITDPTGRIQYVNPAFERVSGYCREEVVGQSPRVLKSGQQDAACYAGLWRTILRGETWSGVLVNRRKDGTPFEEEVTISPVLDAGGRIVNFVAVERDVTAQRQLEGQLRQAQRLESVGQLAAGIAHEINTPTQYVGDNTRFLRDGFAALLPLAQRHCELLARVDAGPLPAELVAAARAQAAAADLDFLAEEVPRAIEQSLEGLGRVARIVRALKEFSHPGQEGKTPVDLNRTLENSLLVARNEWKYVADVVEELDRDLPAVPCIEGSFNQVVLNLVINAAHAIRDVVGDSGRKGCITITTRRCGEWAEILVADTGTGIPEAIRERVFDPFFTTKGVGRGSGQGLSIARSIIVDKHQGEISFTTEPGRGTTFLVRLPLVDAPAPAPVAV